MYKRLFITETKLFLRDIGNPFFILVFPTLLLLVLGFVMPGMQDRITDVGPPYDGLTGIAVYTPVILTLTAATAALTVFPVYVVTYREQGVLLRLATTPVLKHAVLWVLLAISAGAVVLGMLIALGFGSLFFGLPVPVNLPLTLLAVALMLLVCFTLGALPAALAPRAGVASAVGMGLYFPLLFFAGLWIPTPLMPPVLANIAEFSPLGAATHAITSTWFKGELPMLEVLVTLAYSAVFAFLAIRYFKWR